MSKAFILLAILLLAFSVGIAYAFSGGGGPTSTGSRDGGTRTTPPPPARSTDDSGRMMNKTNETMGQNKSIRAMMYKLREKALECGEQETMKARIMCRLALRKNSTAGLNYVPEECRGKSGTEQQECFDLYDKVQSCRDLKDNDAKFACVREKLNKTGNITSEFRGCQASQNPTACMALAKEKVHYMAKFKLYNLENAAEKLLDRGVSNATVTDFIAKMEQLKLDYNNATTKEGKIAVLKMALAAWKDFKKEAISELKAARGAGEGNSTNSSS